MTDNDTILEAIKSLDNKVDGMKRTLFGSDGRGGMNATIIELSQHIKEDISKSIKDLDAAVFGVPGVPGLITTQTKLKERQRIWNAILMSGHGLNVLFQGIMKFLT